MATGVVPLLQAKRGAVGRYGSEKEEGGAIITAVRQLNFPGSKEGGQAMMTRRERRILTLNSHRRREPALRCRCHHTTTGKGFYPQLAQYARGGTARQRQELCMLEAVRNCASHEYFLLVRTRGKGRP